MTVSPFNLQSGAASFVSATAGGEEVFTVEASYARTLSKVLVTNTDTASAVTFSVYHIPSGGSFSGDDYVVIKALEIPPSDGDGGCEDIRELAGLILEAGDKLVYLAGTASKLKHNTSGMKASV